MKTNKIAQIKNNIQNNNIAIMGHMGSGKSLIGRLIAQNLNFEHIDSDRLIELITKKSINDIFSKKGENYFRNIEEKTIINLCNKKKIILSLGGGSILSKKVRDFLVKNNYITLFIDVDFEILSKRLEKSSKRPLLKNVDIKKKLKDLDKERRKYYLLADIILKNYDDPQKIVSKFLEEYKKINEKNN